MFKKEDSMFANLFLMMCSNGGSIVLTINAHPEDTSLYASGVMEVWFRSVSHSIGCCSI